METTDAHEVERTVKVNVGYVGDLRSALEGCVPNQRIVVDTWLGQSGVIEEITIADDGSVVIYVGPIGGDSA